LPDAATFGGVTTGKYENRGYDNFGGSVAGTMVNSESWWPPRPQPPAGAPNVVVIIVDDVGFADIGCFGGEIRTPNLDRLAADGVRLANFHVNPMCSPTRASLLTGMNSHSVGVGHVAQDDPGFPGYAGELASDVNTAAEVFRANGYATFMVGKWHLAKDSDIGPDGPRHSWPLQRGFDRYYGILDAFTNLHHPHELVIDNSHPSIDSYPDGYYLTDDLTTQAIAMVKAQKTANVEQPFFLYVAHPAAHAPLLAKADDIDRYRGVYEKGWDEIRLARHARQIELGIIAPDTPLSPRPTEAGDDVVAWDSLDPQSQQLFAREMAVFAGMVDCIDQSVGTLRAALEQMGEWENTIVVFCSDNGASREGQANGTTNYYNYLTAMLNDWDTRALDAARLDLIGSPQAMSHYPRGWANAGNTPFRLYKINTHAGGHSVPFIMHGPGVGAAVGAGAVRSQYQHVTDVLPTLIAMAGVVVPAMRDGVPVRSMHGSSMVPVLASSGAPSTHGPQYTEMLGHRHFTDGQYEIVTRRVQRTPFTDDDWELYDVVADPVQLNDLAAGDRERVLDLARQFDEAAWANQVYPLDEGSGYRWIIRPPDVDVYDKPVTLWPGTPTLNRWRSSRLIWSRSFRITVSFSCSAGDRGTLVAHGDQGGGYALVVDAGRVGFALNDGHGGMTRLDLGALADGAHVLVADVEAPGKQRWNWQFSLDGKAVASLPDVAALFPMAPFEGINVGIDRRSPVDWARSVADGPFAYTGTINSVRYEPGELAPDNGARFVDFLRSMGSRYE
jgi:arylsulfatase A-like enzyme